MQSFDYIYNSFCVGEVYKIDGVGYTVVTSKSLNKITFVVIMHINSTWAEHWQDVDKHIQIKQGVYLDLYTGKEYTDQVDVKAYEPSYFKAIGKEDLILKGEITR